MGVGSRIPVQWPWFLCAAFLFGSVAMPCAAQSNTGAFLGGDLLFVRTSTLTPDPPGGGYLVPYYYRTLEWPVAGIRADAGGFISRRWSLGAEFAWRASTSGQITEESHGHTDREVVSSTLTSRESLVSAIVRFHAQPGASVDVQPAGGFTISMSEQSLTNRQGVSYYPGFAPFPFTRPDVAERRTRWGLVGGADAVFRVHPHVSIVATGRLHWMRRDNPDPYTRIVPGVGPFVLQIGGGVRWQSQR